MNPTISQVIDMDETNDQKFDQLINETDHYIEENVKLFDEIFSNKSRYIT
jgi:hypothetical protein